MIKKFLSLFLSSLIIFAILTGTGVYMLYAFKLMVSHSYAVVISVVAIAMFLTYGILDTIKLKQLELVITSYIDSKLANAKSDQTEAESNYTADSEYSNLDPNELNYKTTDLTLHDYSLRALFVEGSDPITRMNAIISYLTSRIDNNIDYSLVPLPIILEIIKRCDDNVPESSKNIIYSEEHGESGDSDMFDSLEDLDVNNLN